MIQPCPVVCVCGFGCGWLYPYKGVHPSSEYVASRIAAWCLAIFIANNSSSLLSPCLTYRYIIIGQGLLQAHLVEYAVQAVHCAPRVWQNSKVTLKNSGYFFVLFSCLLRNIWDFRWKNIETANFVIFVEKCPFSPILIYFKKCN